MTPSTAILFDLFMIRLLVGNSVDVLLVSDVVRRRTSSHLEATTVPGDQGDETARKRCHFGGRASSSARDVERRRPHLGASRHVVASGCRPIDAELPLP